MAIGTEEAFYLVAGAGLPDAPSVGRDRLLVHHILNFRA